MKGNLLKWIFYGFLLVLISGCPTPYQSRDFMGFGYSETQIDGNTVKVNFRGNGITSQDITESYAIYRCAEVTLEHGYDYFVVVTANTDARDQSIIMPATYTSSTRSNFSANMYGTPYGATGFGSGVSNTYGTYVPPQIFSIRQYGSSATIKMFKGEKPAGELSAYNARDVVKYMGKNIKR